MKKWQKRIIICIPILFVAVNLFLILQKDSKITRIERINNWENGQIGHLQNSLFTQGIVIPTEEYHIYFDQKLGSFSQFLVKEGEEVSKGSPLFEYSPFNTDHEIAKLESEKTELENKASSVETTIHQLEQLLTQAKKGQKEDQPEPTSIYMIESDIYQKELEKDLYLNEASKRQEQIQNIQNEPDIFTVESEFDGYVKELKHDLSDPVITISSTIPSIQGLLNETEINKVSEGMKVSISNSTQKDAVTGSIAEVSPLPKSEPEMGRESTYPFNIQLENPSEDLITGKHVNVEIILKEATDALIVPNKSINKKKDSEFVYVLTPSGTIEKRSVQTGIKENQKREIVSGMNKEEIFVSNYNEVKYNSNSPFTTPVKIKELSKTNLKKNLKSEWKYIVRGFFARNL